MGDYVGFLLYGYIRFLFSDLLRGILGDKVISRVKFHRVVWLSEIV